MNLPNQSKPVMRNGSMSKTALNGVVSSDACGVCCTLCKPLPSLARWACEKACQLIPGCHC